jgi:hypothetical protein
MQQIEFPKDVLGLVVTTAPRSGVAVKLVVVGYKSRRADFEVLSRLSG